MGPPTTWDAAKENQLWTLDEFRERKQPGEGIIVIFDDTETVPIAHFADCSWVTERSFRWKMVDMRGEHGRYWWFGRFADAKREVGARRCKHRG